MLTDLHILLSFLVYQKDIYFMKDIIQLCLKIQQAKIC